MNNDNVVTSDLFRALVETRNHWSWLAITGYQHKYTYVPARQWPFLCRCCEYSGATLEDEDTYRHPVHRDCNLCPLLNYAWFNNSEYEGLPCLNIDSSLYEAWKLLGEHKHYAELMVQACNRAIEDLLIQGSNKIYTKGVN